MPLHLLLLRGILGILCVLFAYALGKAIERRRRGRVRDSVLIAWGLRTFVTGFGVFWRIGFDALSIAVLVLAVLSGALGFWNEWKPKRQQGQPDSIFPKL